MSFISDLSWTVHFHDSSYLTSAHCRLLLEMQRSKAETNQEDLVLIGNALAALGEWQSESRAENARTIFEDFLQPAIENLTNGKLEILLF